MRGAGEQSITVKNGKCSDTTHHSAASGQRLLLARPEMTASKQPFLRALPDDHPANELTLAIVGGRPGEEPCPWGSAVFIGPGIALSATHVLHDLWNHLDSPEDWVHTEQATFAVQAIQYAEGENNARLWHIERAFHSDAIDIVILQLVPDHDLPGGYDWPYLTLDVAHPEVGTEVQAFGFPESDVRFIAEAGGWVLEHQPAGSIGKVTQVFPLFRDNAKLHYPSFEMDLEIKGGMSGGPVFDKSGHLRGIVCSSFTFAKADAPISYASTLWPSLALPVCPTSNLSVEHDQPRLLHLAQQGAITAINHEGITLPDQPGNVHHVTYDTS